MTSVVIRNRDYAAEMRRLIDERRSSSSYNAGLLAHDIVQYLLTEDRELLLGWFEGRAVESVRQVIVAADAATRNHARINSRAGVFAAAAKAAEDGDDGPLRQGFLQAIYVIDDLNTRKALKDMTADDVLYVAAGYDDRARSAKLEAAFFTALAKKVGDGKVSDYFNNTQLAELRFQFTGK